MIPAQVWYGTPKVWYHTPYMVGFHHASSSAAAFILGVRTVWFVWYGIQHVRHIGFVTVSDAARQLTCPTKKVPAGTKNMLFCDRKWPFHFV